MDIYHIETYLLCFQHLIGIHFTVQQDQIGQVQNIPTIYSAMFITGCNIY